MSVKQLVIVTILVLLTSGLVVWLICISQPLQVNLPDVYRDYPSDTLGITEPVEVKESAVWEDGGTTFLVLKDASGTEFKACLDGRDFGGPYKDLYLGAVHPENDGAYSVGIAGPEEAALFAVLVRYFDAHPVNPSEKLPLTRPQWHQRFAQGFMRSLEKRLKNTYRPEATNGAARNSHPSAE